MRQSIVDARSLHDVEEFLMPDSAPKSYSRETHDGARLFGISDHTASSVTIENIRKTPRDISEVTANKAGFQQAWRHMGCTDTKSFQAAFGLVHEECEVLKERLNRLLSFSMDLSHTRHRQRPRILGKKVPVMSWRVSSSSNDVVARFSACRFVRLLSRRRLLGNCL